jgi:hypothetical protein
MSWKAESLVQIKGLLLGLEFQHRGGWGRRMENVRLAWVTQWDPVLKTNRAWDVAQVVEHLSTTHKLKPQYAKISEWNKTKPLKESKELCRLDPIHNLKLDPQTRGKKESYEMLCKSRVWWHRPLTLALGRMRQEDLEFEASPGYIVSETWSWETKTKENKTNKKTSCC